MLMTLACEFTPAYAIPSPATLALVGNGMMYPGLLIASMLILMLKYVWIKTKLYRIWYLHHSRIFAVILITATLLLPTLMLSPKGQAITPALITEWKKTSAAIHVIDLRDTANYNKVHVFNALNETNITKLHDVIQRYPHDIFVLYCEYGVTSSISTDLSLDKTLLNQALLKKRLYYIPQGIHHVRQLQPLVPTIVHLPWKYAQFMIQKHPFTRLTDVSSLPARYQTNLARGITPITDSKDTEAHIVKQLSTLTLPYIYLTDSTLHTSFPWQACLISIVILFSILFSIRYRQLFTQRQGLYPWLELIYGFISSLLVVRFLFELSLPFDMYLFQTVQALPFNATCVVPVYLFFAAMVRIHCRYSQTKRLHWLQHHHRMRYTRSAQSYQSRFSIWKIHRVLKKLSYRPTDICQDILWFLAISLVVYLLTISVSFLWLTSMFLSIPLLVDSSLYLLAKRSKSLLSLCHIFGFPCHPKASPHAHFSTYHPVSLGRVTVTMGDTTATLGLFTAQWLDNELPISKDTCDTICCLLRRLLLCTRQDITMYLDRQYAVVDIVLHTQSSSTCSNKFMFIEHYQTLPQSPEQLRFSAVLYEDIFKDPTPLLLDMLNHRWAKHGGNLKALRKLGIFLKSNSKTQTQFIACSNQIYVDMAYERAIFSANRLQTFVRKHLLNHYMRLSFQCVLHQYDTHIAPKNQVRLTKLETCIYQSLSANQLQRIIRRALKHLHQESALWQSHISLLHQQFWMTYQHTISSHTAHTIHDSAMAQIPSYYSFVTHADIPQRASSESQTFATLEKLRTHMRTMQLKEWHLIGLLLKKLQQTLCLPISLAFLSYEDFARMPRHRQSLLKLLQRRKKDWELRQQLPLANEFSLAHLETATNQSFSASVSKPLRVSGHQQQVLGRVVWFKPHLALSQLPPNTILLADNLSPEQLLSCQHIRAVILQKGSYLSHTAIIAREKNIVLITQYHTPVIEGAILWIQQDTHITVLDNSTLTWHFLEDIVSDSTVGAKAQRLAIMRKQGFHVPQGIVFKQDMIEKIEQAYDNYRPLLAQILQAISTTVHSLPASHSFLETMNPADTQQDIIDKKMPHAPVILRSSTNIEDGHAQSFAGLFYSQANITSVDDLKDAMLNAWNNLQKRTQDMPYVDTTIPISLNLILQPYLQGQWGGVLFTQSHLCGHMHVEIAQHGIESVTNGTACVSFLFDQNGKFHILQGTPPSWEAHHYQALYRLGKALESLFNAPQDVEWLMKEDTIYVVQSRDITHSTH